VVKDGADGALLADPSGAVLHEKGDAVVPVDTTGAGDTFDAGFIAGYLDGWSLHRCLALANVCGGLSTTGAGGVDAQPTMQEALDRMPEVEGRLAPP
jgi:sugar/nucleoside kinase (ribokinase family)